MIKLKTLLKEVLNKNIVNTILDELEPTIKDMISQIEEWYVEKFQKPVTDSDREMFRWSLIVDLVKAVELYTQPTDKLVSISARRSGKGSIQISAQIERDGTVYPFETEAILAGGYSIQQLHYRYITKTRLGKTGNSEITSIYKEKIKKLSKIEKINQEIESFQKQIDRLNNEIETNSKLSDKEIINLVTSSPDYYSWPSWEEMIQRDAAKNYDNNEAAYNKKKTDAYNNIVPGWKKKNIGWKQDHLKSLQTAVNKLQKKLTTI
tara:strand:+ start:2898 stop:3689 length:792 start_codon:yes stop_codon:yes gene_type:complete